jgi:chromosome segregation ATPase
MLLQELQVLRRTVTDAREAFVEQERTFASLDSVPNERDYALLVEQHRKMHKEYEDLMKESPELDEQNEALEQAVDRERHEIRRAEAEVTRLKEVLGGEEEKQRALQAQLRELERYADRTKAACAELEAEKEETLKKKNHRDVLKEMVISDKNILQTQREMLQVGDRKKKKDKSASPSPPPGAASAAAGTSPLLSGSGNAKGSSGEKGSSSSPKSSPRSGKTKDSR